MMKTFRKHLETLHKDPGFAERYEEEQKLLSLSMKIHEAREERGLSQIEVANRAQVTQQQLSKLENGVNCNMLTFLKVCNALDLNLEVGTISLGK
jgi:DNA-binding XRE family transcriptional regulator